MDRGTITVTKAESCGSGNRASSGQGLSPVMLKENHKETRFHEVSSRVVSGTKGAPREEPFVSKTHRLLPAVMLSVKMARRFIGFTCRVLHHTGSLYQGKETLLTSGSPRRQHNG